MDKRESEMALVDCRGMACPEPVWHVRQAIARLQPGERIEVLATDPLAEIDLGVFCQRTGHRLESAVTRDGVLSATIRVRTAPRPDAD